MRFSRTTPTGDGAYVTTTTGCTGLLVGLILKWTLVVLLTLGVAFWPTIVVMHNLRGAPEWLVGISGQLAWFVLVGLCVREARRNGPAKGPAA